MGSTLCEPPGYTIIRNNIQVSVKRDECQEKNERKCTYNITFRRVHVTIVAVGKQWVLHILSVCICSLRYPACNVHGPYCHLWLHGIFPHYHIKDMIFEKKNVPEHKMCVLSLSTIFICNISHSKNIWETYDKICKLVFM